MDGPCTQCILLASSPGQSHVFNATRRNMGVAWGPGYSILWYGYGYWNGVGVACMGMGTEFK